jgi:UDP-2,3-diacylglucosamine pyrophosphatase LpxH
MKAVFGDIHGRALWKEILAKDYEAVYLLGDYWDSFDIPYKEQHQNFLDIIDAAKKDTRLHLCLGNHDLHYLCEGEEYSGYQF